MIHRTHLVLCYRNHKVLAESARHVTRFIGLAKVGNSAKKKVSIAKLYESRECLSSGFATRFKICFGADNIFKHLYTDESFLLV